MKKTIYSLLAITALLFSSCESFTEGAKGQELAYHNRPIRNASQQRV